MVNEVRTIYFKKCDSKLVQEFLLQIRFFRDSLFDRLLPVFDDIKNEADVKAKLSSSSREDEESIEWFIRTSNVKQSMLNLYVVAIFTYLSNRYLF